MKYLRILKYVEEVARCGSIRKAANGSILPLPLSIPASSR
jgi:hypothetical protein